MGLGAALQADLKAWAAKTLPTLQHHLVMAKELNKYPAARDEQSDGQWYLGPRDLVSAPMNTKCPAALGLQKRGDSNGPPNREDNSQAQEGAAGRRPARQEVIQPLIRRHAGRRAQVSGSSVSKAASVEAGR
jgi:hypothetical protein